MRKLIVLTIFGLSVSSCLTAPSNGRSDATEGSGPRAGENTDCTTAGTNKCATTHSALSFTMAYREKGQKQYTFDELQILIAKGETPKTIKLITEENVGLEIDQDGDEVNTGVTVNMYSENLIDCGHEPQFNGVKARYTNCSGAKNNYPTWRGGINGISGEGDWKLVMRDVQKGITLWLDTRTNLIWSNKITDAVWKDASGTSEIKDDNICNSLTELTTDENKIAHIAWRLPNRNEFLQADINGSRFVLRTENESDNADEFFWTASQVDNDLAWTIQNSTGILKQENKSNTAQVRCVGVKLK